MMLKDSLKYGVLATAVAGLFSAGGCAHDKAATAGHAKDGTAMVKCGGVNECKGKGTCSGADNSCKSHNECKGKGWVELSPQECSTQGGTVVASAQ